MEPDQLVDEIEGVMLAIAEGDKAALTKLTAVVQALDTPVDKAIEAVLLDNLEMIIDDLTTVAEEAERRSLVLALAGKGVAPMLVRDALAAILRKVHGDYPDPAGLIRAVGVLDESSPVEIVLQRWEAFKVLERGALVWHSAHQLGTVKDVDAFSDMVTVSFQTNQAFTLEQALLQLFVCKPSTIAATLATGRQPVYKPTKSPQEFDVSLAQCFIPELQEPGALAETLLVPKYMKLRDYEDWRKRGTGSGASAPAEVRSWAQSRSLEELTDALDEETSITVSAAELVTIKRAFSFAYKKPAAAQLFAGCLAKLWMLADDTTHLEQMVKDMPEDVYAWSDQEEFVNITCKLPSKLNPDWLRVTLARKGGEWFMAATTGLPLRTWPAMEAVINESEHNVHDLFEAAVKRFRRGTATADVALWMWNQAEDTSDIFANPTAVLRVLGRDAKRDFLKSSRELRKLIMDSQDFQRDMMAGGTDEGIANFARMVKGSAVLNKGEQQSLLIKAVRLFPHAEEIVAERRKVVAKKPLPRLCSIRSMQERANELEKIVNVEIPENSRAIAHARSYGDLRENFEYKAAKDKQRLLMARRADLEKGLGEAVPTDFSDVKAGGVVVPGLTVKVDMDGEAQQYHVLGMWDSDPEHDIISFDTPLAKLMMGKNVGDAITAPQGVPCKIVGIERLPDEILEWVKIPSD
jgi:transcription elongation GreA/GreB family factor